MAAVKSSVKRKAGTTAASLAQAPASRVVKKKVAKVASKEAPLKTKKAAVSATRPLSKSGNKPVAVKTAPIREPSKKTATKKVRVEDPKQKTVSRTVKKGGSSEVAPKKSASKASVLKSGAAKKGSLLKSAPEPTSMVEEEEEEDDDGEILEGFPTMDSEDEDEEDDALAKMAAPSADEVRRMPSSRDDATVRQRLEKANKKHAKAPAGAAPTGVVYIGRLPHGFFEDQLRAYFSQFGDINRLRLSRNKKTGHSRHYGFVEFASADVAEIVVDTMNNYLLDGHLLQLAMIPPQQVNPNLWVGANRKFRRVPTDRVERLRRSRSRSAEERAKVNDKLLQRQKRRRAALQRAGIDYEFPGYQ